MYLPNFVEIGQELMTLPAHEVALLLYRASGCRHHRMFTSLVPTAFRMHVPNFVKIGQEIMALCLNANLLTRPSAALDTDLSSHIHILYSIHYQHARSKFLSNLSRNDGTSTCSLLSLSQFWTHTYRRTFTSVITPTFHMYIPNFVEIDQELIALHTNTNCFFFLSRF